MRFLSAHKVLACRDAALASSWSRYSSIHWEHGFTLLHAAARNGDYDLCEILLAHGADIRARDDTGPSRDRPRRSLAKAVPKNRRKVWKKKKNEIFHLKIIVDAYGFQKKMFYELRVMNDIYFGVMIHVWLRYVTVLCQSDSDRLHENTRRRKCRVSRVPKSPGTRGSTHSRDGFGYCQNHVVGAFFFGTVNFPIKR